MHLPMTSPLLLCSPGMGSENRQNLEDVIYGWPHRMTRCWKVTQLLAYVSQCMIKVAVGLYSSCVFTWLDDVIFPGKKTPKLRHPGVECLKTAGTAISQWHTDYIVCKTLQSMMNAKLSQQRFCPCHENDRLIKTFPIICSTTNMWVSSQIPLLRICNLQLRCGV